VSTFFYRHELHIQERNSHGIFRIIWYEKMILSLSLSPSSREGFMRLAILEETGSNEANLLRKKKGEKENGS
jgi:hypothetical protein